MATNEVWSQRWLIRFKDGREQQFTALYDWDNPPTLRSLALSEHLDTHGCAERGGFAYCDEAMKLFRALPLRKQVIIA